MHRRRFLHSLGSAGAALGSRNFAAASSESSGFFQLQQSDGRWRFITPEGRNFFSLALNHIDAAPLRETENGALWKEKYGNSMERWLKEAVRPDLQAWNFNSVGWTQEVLVRGPLIHRHSPAFTFEEYQWLGLPYCHLLPFAETHQWENETRLPNFFSRDFEDWCDYVARSQCARFVDDPKLIGYFYTDCPLWIHTRPDNKWKGPLFDPAKLKTDAGQTELRRLATRYYQVTHDAIRRYDAHHLILGDRYEANAPISIEVMESAKPFVDVFCFQDFKDPVKTLDEWHRRSGKPVLWADGAKPVPQKDPATRESIMGNDGRWWGEVLRQLRENPGCVGAHLCGAYLRNHARNRGLRDGRERPDEVNIALIAQANREHLNWAASTGGTR